MTASGKTPTARIRYNRHSLESAVKAAIVLANDSRWNAPAYVFATAYGFVVCPRKPPGTQNYYAVEPRKNPELVVAVLT